MTLLKKYQQTMYCVEQFGGEIGKLLRFYPEYMTTINTLILINITISKINIILGFVLITLIAAIFGWILVRHNNAKINNSIRNEQNPELMEILELLKEIKQNQK